MNKKQIAVCVFWAAFVSFVGPALISHPSYELPIAGLALTVGGLWATYLVFIKRAKA